MMWKFKLTAALFVFGIFISGLSVNAEEHTKEYYKSWDANSVESLEIVNKFGEVRVLNERADSVTVEVTITVDARDERKANGLLDMIEVEFKKSGGALKALTTIENDFKNLKEFSIDYVVNIPSDKDLDISNKYGNTFVSTLTGNGDFNIQYGNLSANELMGENLRISLAYGKSNVSAASDLEVEVSYSGMSFGEIGNLKVESKYSSLDIEEGKSIEISSKYDKFDFEEVESVIASTKYSHLRIEELARHLEIEAGYGSVKVSEVAGDFESISITNSYGQISLGLDENYSVDASCKYCGISYPEDEFTGDQIKENNTKSIIGKVGKGIGGKVYVRSRYGEIKLRN